MKPNFDQLMTWLKSRYFGGSTQPVGPLFEPTEVQNRKGAESGLGSAVHLAMFNHNNPVMSQLDAYIVIMTNAMTLA